MIRTIQNGAVLTQGLLVSVEQTPRRRKANNWELEHVTIGVVSVWGRLVRGDLIESMRSETDE